MEEERNKQPTALQQAANQKNAQLLIIDDDFLISDTLGFFLAPYFKVSIASNPLEANALLGAKIPFDIALVDLGLPPNPHQPDEGFKLIEKLIQHHNNSKIVILSGQNDEKNIAYALSLGAVDFIAKPADPKKILAILMQQWQITVLENLTKDNEKNKIIGQSRAILQVQKLIEQFADLCFPLLIEGESGTGKELVAQSLHLNSKRAKEPYLAINCAALSPELLESQLFGHKKGAFSGAIQDHIGFFEKAKNGTLFLDEIGEMPLGLQAKLLRVLENGEFYPVGSSDTKIALCRVVAATNRSLHSQVKQNDFRIDLYHRLGTLEIQLPPLRDRENDWLLLFYYLAKKLEAQIGTVCLSEEAQLFLSHYSFPGNVRELKNIVIRLGSKHKNQLIKKEHLINEIEPQQNISHASLEAVINENSIKYKIEQGIFDLNQSLVDFEKTCIELAMKINNQNLSQAARDLHINRSTLHSRIQKYDGNHHEK